MALSQALIGGSAEAVAAERGPVGVALALGMAPPNKGPASEVAVADALCAPASLEPARPGPVASLAHPTGVAHAPIQAAMPRPRLLSCLNFMPRCYQAARALTSRPEATSSHLTANALFTASVTRGLAAVVRARACRVFVD
jgi:hypothetical protein